VSRLKALVISVGTGTSVSEDAVRSLAEAIAFSVNHHNPDKTFFIVSKESSEKTLPLVLRKTKLKKYEAVRLENPDDIQQVYEQLRKKFKEIRSTFNNLAVDYTSGTKAMTGALAILGAIFEADTLSYITGKRIGGIVQHGTETINIVRPYFATSEQKIKTAIEFFNKNQFQAAISTLQDIKASTGDPEIISRIEPIEKLAKAYDGWDKFHHQEAFNMIRDTKIPELNGNKRFLGTLVSQLEKPECEPEPFYIADLINNAKRRGETEKKYDDAVARLYRTIELIAHYRLKKKHGIKPSQVDPNQIPPELKEKWNIKTRDETIKLSLQMSYELLKAKEDTLGEKHLEDRKIQNLLSQRNQSILAHGTKPVNRETFHSLLEKTIEYAHETVDNLKQLLEDSKFIKWKENHPVKQRRKHVEAHS